MKTKVSHPYLADAVGVRTPLAVDLKKAPSSSLAARPINHAVLQRDLKVGHLTRRTVERRDDLARPCQIQNSKIARAIVRF